MASCLDVLLIERYIAGGCLADERTTVDVHLSTCATCRDRVEQATHRSDETRVIDEDRTRTAWDNGNAACTPPTDAATAQSLFPGYEVTSELPRGGQAIVYKAIHLATKTPVAIKVLLPTLLASAKARYSFEREAELIAGLDHPNIVGIHDSGILHGQYYFVMHYVDGCSLDRYVEDRDLSVRERVMLFNKVCAAVSYAHQRGIIHRDLKFANILVDSFGEPQILDFGLAKAIGADEQAKPEAVATMTGQWAGTLSTMAPEQTLGIPGKVDVRADIYSLGVILYRMLTGEYPYEVSGSIIQVLKRIQEQEPVRPRQLVRQLDSDIEAILLCALAKDPEQRYPSAADLRKDLDNWLNGSPIQIKSISTWYLVRKIVSKHRYVSTVLVLLLAIILSFVSITTHLLLTTRKAEQKSRAIGDQWRTSAMDDSVLSRSIAFTYFLDLLHAKNTAMSQWFERSLPQGSKERRAAAFLLNSQSFAEYQQAAAGDPEWFRSFILGEHLGRDGNDPEAIRAYQDSYRALQQTPVAEMSKSDRWLARNVAANLYDLTGDHRWLEQESTVEPTPSGEGQ